MQSYGIMWFDRQFTFSFSIDLFPNILARLRGTPARLDEIFAGRSASAIIDRVDGKWSAQENAGHLLAMEELWFARMEDYRLVRPGLTVADLQNQKTDAADYNGMVLQHILHEFRSARMQLLRSANEADRTLLERSIPHPRLNLPMRFVDHLYFVAEHDDHHLARIWDLLNT